jgi:hypothetical protein
VARTGRLGRWGKEASERRGENGEWAPCNEEEAVWGTGGGRRRRTAARRP